MKKKSTYLQAELTNIATGISTIRKVNAVILKGSTVTRKSGTIGGPKTLASPEIKDFKQAYMKELTPCKHLTYEETTDGAIKDLWDEWLCLPVPNCECVWYPFKTVKFAKTDHEGGNAFLAWSILLAFYSSKAKRDLIKLILEFNNCV
jgi:hypothetical protein